MKKKFFIMVLVLMIIMTASVGVCGATMVTDGEDFYSLGDANGDGQIDARDLVRMKKYSVGLIDDISIVAADIDSDSEVKASDITAMRQILLNGFASLEEDSDWSGVF